MMVAGVTEQLSTLCMDHSARNKDQKLVSRFYEDRIFYRLLIAVPLKMYHMEGNFGAAKFGEIDDRPKIHLFSLSKFLQIYRVLREYQTN